MHKLSYREARIILAQVLSENDALDEYMTALDSELNVGYSPTDEKTYHSSGFGDQFIVNEFSWSTFRRRGEVKSWSSIHSELISRLIKAEKEKEAELSTGSIPNPFISKVEALKPNHIQVEIGSAKWALCMLADGEKIRRKKWCDEDYFKYDFSEDSNIENEVGGEIEFSEVAHYDEWEIYEEPEEEEEESED